jgi:hypothetical protein
MGKLDKEDKRRKRVNIIKPGKNRTNGSIKQDVFMRAVLSSTAGISLWEAALASPVSRY